MARLNKVGATLMKKYQAHAATDVTGFGLIGHAQNLASNQMAEVNFEIHTLPIITGMAAVDDKVKLFKLLDGLSAETSGGLFVAMSAENAKSFIKDITEIEGQTAWIVGDVVDATQQKLKRTAKIIDNVSILQV
jgi:selenide,water dikinase